MKVDLTKEQVDFIRYLCHGVDNDYENYSIDEQNKRECMASDINAILSMVDETDSMIDEEKLDELARESWHNFMKLASAKHVVDGWNNFIFGFISGYRKAIRG